MSSLRFALGQALSAAKNLRGEGEGSRSMGIQMLRCAQHDSIVTPPFNGSTATTGGMLRCAQHDSIVTLSAAKGLLDGFPFKLG